jgi:presenilin-like A22 family membrane protease
VKTTDALPVLAMVALLLAVDGAAMLVAGPFKAAGAVAFENPDDPWNIVYFFLVLLPFTVLILLIAKFWKKKAIQAIVLAATGVLDVYVFYPLLAMVLPSMWLTLGIAVAASAVLLTLLVKKPEWYIVNASAVLSAIGATAMLGVSLNPLVTVALLIAMSVYDALSVYKTKHMIDLADTLVDLKLPIVFVVPKKRGYSLRRETKTLKQKLKEGEEREAFFLGVGDAVIPGTLTVSAFHTLAGNTLPIALSTLAGTLGGFAALMLLVMKGKPQAGLPFLCTGAIIGYAVSSLWLHGTLIA